VSRESSRSFRFVSRVDSRPSRECSQASRPSSSRPSLRLSSYSCSCNFSSNSTTIHPHSATTRTRTARTSSRSITVLAWASAEAYNSLASTSIFYESESRLLMAASCIFSSSSLSLRCSYLANALDLSEVVRSLSREAHNRKRQSSSIILPRSR
jgi:predicted small metal-binding protein